MFSDDEIISIHEVCLSDKFDRKDLSFNNDSGKHEPEISRSLRSSDEFFPENEQQQASFAWTEADGCLASLVSEPNFCQDLDLDLDSELSTELKEADTPRSVRDGPRRGSVNLSRKTPHYNFNDVSSTSASSTSDFQVGRTRVACKVDKTDPRSRLHFVKYLKRHGRTVKLWECGICSREFQHQYTLVRHLPTHTDERNFHCDACGKSFRQLSTLSQHRAIHSTDRPYACEVCKKTFNRVSTLISHRKTHSGNKPYKCHLCPKGFHQKGNLRNHLFTHTNERPYRCNICYKGFNQQSNLVCHKNKAHPDDNKCSNIPRGRRPTRAPSDQPRPESNGSTIENCEVSSSIGPHIPSNSSVSWTPNLESVWELPSPSTADWTWSDQEWSGGAGAGVVVDPITSYRMGVAMATINTPFALLKSDSGPPVLVKMIDAILPGMKQVFVPATPEDLKASEKINTGPKNKPMRPEVDSSSNVHPNMTPAGVNMSTKNPKDTPSNLPLNFSSSGSTDIRIPAMPAIRQKNRHSRLNLRGEGSQTYGKPGSSRETTLIQPPQLQRLPSPPLLPPSLTRGQPLTYSRTPYDLQDGLCSAPLISSSPPPPSLDLMHGMDLFETIDCMPLGPQIVAVGSMGEPPLSDDSDVFIGEFEESIKLSDSD